MSDSDHSHTPAKVSHFWGRLMAVWRVFRSKDGVIEAAIREADEAPEEAPDSGGRRRMLLKVAEFDGMSVKDVMIPRADIEAMDINTPLDEVFAKFSEVGLSRMPLYRGSLDDPVGVVHVKDILAEMGRRMKEGEAPLGPDKVLSKLRRDILFVPPSMRLPVLLVKMQSARCHLALVIDEYGGTHGLLSIEDLVEQIVGDIEDEHDENELPGIRQRAIGLWEIEARASIEAFAELSGLEFSLAGQRRRNRHPGRASSSRCSAACRSAEKSCGTLAALNCGCLRADPRRIIALQIRAPLAEPVNVESADKGSS